MIPRSMYAHCLRCGESWLKRTEHPVRCAHCKTPYWNVKPGTNRRGRPEKKARRLVP